MKHRPLRLGALVLPFAFSFALPAQRNQATRTRSQAVTLEVPDGGQIVIRIHIQGTPAVRELRLVPRRGDLELLRGLRQPAREEEPEQPPATDPATEIPEAGAGEPGREASREEPAPPCAEECTQENTEENTEECTEENTEANTEEAADERSETQRDAARELAIREDSDTEESSEDADENEESDGDSSATDPRATRGVVISIDIVIHGATASPRGERAPAPRPLPRRREVGQAPELLRHPALGVTSATHWLGTALAALWGRRAQS